MMCLLPAIPDQEIPQHIPSLSNIVPLVVKFTDDCFPLSCFSSTISCLLSKFDWSVSRKPDGTPECNIVSLFSPDILADKIVLVESAHSIEVYIEAAEEAHQFLPDICSEVRETVFSALTKVLDIMRLTEIEISPAIFCSCKKVVETHTATLIHQKTEHFLRCSTTNRLAGKAQNTHLMWLGSNSQPGNHSSQPHPTLTKYGVTEQVGTKFRTLLLDNQEGTQVDNIEDESRGIPGTKILEPKDSTPKPGVIVGAELSQQAMSFGDQQQSSQPDKGSTYCTKAPSLDLLYKLNVPEQVGTHFQKFGTLLLEDKTGTKVDNIEDELHGKPERINRKILQYWLQGKGLPVTWETLMHTLRDCGLNGLADHIQTSLYT